MTEEYITEVSEGMEERVTNTLSQEFNLTESRILGALSKYHGSLLKPQVRICSGTVPGTSRNNKSENRKPTEDCSQDDAYPEVESCLHPAGTSADSDREKTYHIVKGVRDDFPYWSPGFSSRKQKKTRSTSQTRFCSGNTPAKSEADQILSVLQHWATNRNYANFSNNINGISKLPNSPATKTPTFDRKPEKFELFEDLFQKIHSQLTEGDKINYFHSLMRGDKLQTFKNITSLNREILVETLTVFRSKNSKPKSKATAKHKFQRLFFNPANQKLIDLLDELQKLAKDAFGCRSSDQRRIHTCQNASPPEEID